MNSTVNISGKKYTNQELHDAFSVISKICEEFKQFIIEMALEIKKHIKSIISFIENKKTKKQHDYNWHVPKVMMKNSQVMNRKPLFANIRNQL